MPKIEINKENDSVFVYAVYENPARRLHLFTTTEEIWKALKSTIVDSILSSISHIDGDILYDKNPSDVADLLVNKYINLVQMQQKLFIDAYNARDINAVAGVGLAMISLIMLKSGLME